MDKLSKVYLVWASWGEYSDYTVWDICVVLTKERAKEIANQLEEVMKYRRKFEDRRSKVPFDLEDYQSPHPELDKLAKERFVDKDAEFGVAELPVLE